MRLEDVALPPQLAQASLRDWRAFTASARSFAWGVGVPCVAVAGWIAFYTWREGRALAPRGEELWPFLGLLAVAGLCAWAVRWSRGPEPLRAGLARSGARVTWVGLRVARGSRGRLGVSLRVGLSTGQLVLISVDGPSSTERLAQAKAIEQEALDFFRPTYRGFSPELEQAFRRAPRG
jgi:hypothetical protein